MKNQTGQIFIIALVVMGIMVVNTILITGGVSLYNRNSNFSILSAQAVSLAEAGIDKAVASLNETAGSYTGEESIMGNGMFKVSVNDKDARTKIIESTGFIPDKENPKSKKTIAIHVSRGVGASFSYGLQVGEGGLEMGGESILNGSVYSNGNIQGGGNNRINGDVWVAGGTQLSPEQTDCPDQNCQDFIFGKSVAGNIQYDIAQSFTPSANALVNKVSLKLKKYGSPANLTVRILEDDDGNPDKTAVLASGTLSASLVTAEYGFVDVSLSPSTAIFADQVYWILVDTCGTSTSACNNSPDYWAWLMESPGAYSGGEALWSPRWDAPGSPVWNTTLGDLAFKTFMAGEPTSISMGNGSVVTGDVHANTINNVTVNHNAYYQVINDATVYGVSYPGSSDPSPIVFPVTDANITDWKNEAELIGVTTGNVSGCEMVIGPGKIVGNLAINNNCNVTVLAPLWITGNITTGNTVRFRLDPSFGATSGMMIVDGMVDLGNGNDLLGSGGGGYLMLLSVYDSRQSYTPAIDTGNSAISGVIYAPYGIVSIANGASFKEITAWKIEMGNGATLNYESGLANVNFSSGPTGAYNIVKGTYQMK